MQLSREDKRLTLIGKVVKGYDTDNQSHNKNEELAVISYANCSDHEIH